MSMSIDYYVASDYGQPIEIRFVDSNGDAVDISSYTTTQAVIVKDPGNAQTTLTGGAFTSDGSDGKVRATPTTGQIGDPSDDWKARGRVTSGSAQLSTVWIPMRVRP